MPSATWVLELQDDREQLEEATGIIVTPADITTFKEQVTKLVITHLKENISSHFSFSNNFISAMSIVDYRKAPKADSWTPDLSKYGEEAIGTLLVHYGSEKTAETLHGNLTRKEVFITSDITTEWKTYHQFLVSKPKNDMKAQLKELASNDTFKTLFPNVNKINPICPSIPTMTASVERSFSQIAY